MRPNGLVSLSLQPLRLQTASLANKKSIQNYDDDDDRRYSRKRTWALSSSSSSLPPAAAAAAAARISTGDTWQRFFLPALLRRWGVVFLWPLRHRTTAIIIAPQPRQEQQRQPHGRASMELVDPASRDSFVKLYREQCSLSPLLSLCLSLPLLSLPLSLSASPFTLV